MAAYYLYQTLCIASIIIIFSILITLYLHLDSEINRVMFVASIGLALDAVATFCLGRTDSLTSALIFLRISLIGHLFLGIGMIAFIAKSFTPKVKYVICFFWGFALIGAIFSSFKMPESNLFVRDIVLVKNSGISMLKGKRGIVYNVYNAMAIAMELWGVIIGFVDLFKKIRKKGSFIYNSLYFLIAMFFQGILQAVSIGCFGSIPQITPIYLIFSFGIYYFLMFAVNAMKFDMMAGRSLMDGMGAGFVVLSQKKQFLYANEVAQKLFHGLGEGVLSDDALNIFERTIERGEYQYRINGNVFRISSNRVFRNKKIIGYTFLIHDITAFISLEEQIEENVKINQNVLINISHEIKTPLNALLGASDLIESENLSKQDYRHYADTIKSSVISLNDIVNDIIENSENDIERSSESLTPYSICTLADNILFSCYERSYKPDVKISIRVDKNVPLYAIGNNGKIRRVILLIISNTVRYSLSGNVTLYISGKYLEDGCFEYEYSVVDRTVISEKQNAGSDDDGDGNSSSGEYTTDYSFNLFVAEKIASTIGGTVTLDFDGSSGSAIYARFPSKVDSPRTFEYLGIGERMDIVFVGEKGFVYNELEEACLDYDISLRYCPNLSKMPEPYENGKYQILLFDYEHVSRKALMSEKLEKYTKVEMAEYETKHQEISSDFLQVSNSVNIVILNNILAMLDEMKDNEPIESEEYIAPGISVLVVDDNLFNREFAKTMLAYFKCRVDAVDSGYKCLDIISKGKRYDLILMDYMMDGMDGIETTKKIRCMDSPSNDVPILAFTANAIERAKEKYLAAGMNGFLFKPADMSDFAKALKEYVPNKIKRSGEDDENDEKAQEVPNASLEEEKELPFPEEIMDTKIALSHVEGNEKILRSLLSSFASEIPGKIAKIEECAEEENLKTFTVHVHGVKGSAGALGMEQLAAMMLSMEKAGSCEDKETIEKELPTVLEYYRKVYEVLLPCVERKRSIVSQVEGNNEQQILYKMLDYIDDFEMEYAEKLFEEIKEGSYSKEIGEVIQKLMKAFERVDYYSSKEYTEELIRMFEK